jgi:hypothetical protein
MDSHYFNRNYIADYSGNGLKYLYGLIKSLLKCITEMRAHVHKANCFDNKQTLWLPLIRSSSQLLKLWQRGYVLIKDLLG